jgi:putative CocE/NonD family hydrolase
MAIRKTTLVACLCTAWAVGYAADQEQVPVGPIDSPTALAQSVPALAGKVIAVYREPDRRLYLDNLFRLQLASGAYDVAAKTIDSVRALDAGDSSLVARARHLQYAILAHARVREATAHVSFENAFEQAFRDTFVRLDDRTSAHAIRLFIAMDQAALQRDLLAKLEQYKGRTSLPVADALELIRSYQVDDAYRSFAALSARLIAEDDARRYFIDRDVRVRTPDGGTVCTLIVRPRTAPARIPALLQYTIYVDALRNFADARRSASNGYAGILALVRGKGCSPDDVRIYERDSADAAAVIDWISTQPWSDGRVGMQGGSYSGFTQWAAAKRMPKALKALFAQAAAAPGIDVPMEGNVFWNFVYPYPFYTTNTKLLDDATYNDAERWQRLDRNWYRSGRAYRDLDKIDGTPNQHWQTWIAHPSYDGYWQQQIAYGKDFAKIDIPVLQTAGYYYGGPGAAVYYLTEHYQHNPNAQHYLVIGPYDHFTAQCGTIDAFGGKLEAIAGYPLDPVAQVDLGDLKYQWFDYVLRGAPKPALLQDRINYEVTGANVWKHAPSLPAMAARTMRFHLDPSRSGQSYRLSEPRPAGDGATRLTVDLADRSDVERVDAESGVTDSIDARNGVTFVGDPIPDAFEWSGLFSGHLELMTNKRDFDFAVQPYVLSPQGKYTALPPYWSRASYVEDATQRHLLTPGKRQTLNFTSRRLISHRAEPGSRLVIVLSVIKESGRQINYGTGKDVSDETLAEAHEPLTIEWFVGSFIDMPVGR